MTVYKDYSTFIVMNQEINIISDEFDFGRHTIAEVNGKFYHIGNEESNIVAAVFAWQELNKRDLSTEELKQVMIDNHLTSQGI